MGRKEGGIGSQVDSLSSQVIPSDNIDRRNYACSNNDVIYGAYSDESDPKNQIYAIHSWKASKKNTSAVFECAFMCSILLQNPRLESSAKTTFGHGTLALFNARLESCQREKKIVATKSLQMVAAVICNQVHLCRSQVDFLNYQYVNVE